MTTRVDSKNQQVSTEQLTETRIDAVLESKLFWHAFEIKKMTGEPLADCIREVFDGVREAEKICAPHGSERGGDD